MAIQFRIRSSVDSQGTATLRGQQPSVSHNPSAVGGGSCEANNGDSSRRCGREMSGGAVIYKSQSVPGNGGNGYQALDQSLVSPGRFGG